MRWVSEATVYTFISVRITHLTFCGIVSHFGLPPCTAHVIEEAREIESGVEFMTSTREDWRGTAFEGHLTWHLTLFYLG